MKPTAFLTIILTICLPFMVSAQAKKDMPERGLHTVVLDAGHGGKDPGCSWGDKLEKNLNLNIVLTLGDMIERAYPDVKVIYTRKDDRFIELHERGNIANRANADLFISVHTDAVSNTEAHGSSTYIMGNDKSEKNLAVAQRENSVIVMEGDYEAKYEGYDPNSAESFIIFSLMQYAYSEQSMIFAEMVQKHYSLNTPITNRGARQAPYLVLWRTAMPAVLTELGFMTNAQELAYLKSQKGQNELARMLCNAVKEYVGHIEKMSGKVEVNKPSEGSQTPAKEAATPQKPATTQKPADKKPATPQQPAKQQPEKQTPAKQPQTPAKEASASANVASGYAIQVAASSRKIDLRDPQFKSYRGKVRILEGAGALKYKYCYGEFATQAEAQRHLAELRKSFPGAFVVAYKGNSLVKK